MSGDNHRSLIITNDGNLSVDNSLMARVVAPTSSLVVIYCYNFKRIEAVFDPKSQERMVAKIQDLIRENQLKRKKISLPVGSIPGFEIQTGDAVPIRCVWSYPDDKSPNFSLLLTRQDKSKDNLVEAEYLENLVNFLVHKLSDNRRRPVKTPVLRIFDEYETLLCLNEYVEYRALKLIPESYIVNTMLNLCDMCNLADFTYDSNDDRKRVKQAVKDLHESLWPIIDIHLTLAQSMVEDLGKGLSVLIATSGNTHILLICLVKCIADHYYRTIDGFVELLFHWEESNTNSGSIFFLSYLIQKV